MSWDPLVTSIWSTVTPIWSMMNSSMDSASTLPSTVVASHTGVGRDVSTLLASSVPVRQVHRCKATLQRDPWKCFIFTASYIGHPMMMRISLNFTRRPSQWKSLRIIHFIVWDFERLILGGHWMEILIERERDVKIDGGAHRLERRSIEEESLQIWWWWQ